MERYLVRRGLNRIIALPIVLTLIYAGLLLWQLNRMLNEGAWVEHTTTVLAESNQLQKHIALQEGALRGWMLTGSAAYISEFNAEDSTIDGIFLQLHEQVLDNPLQTRRLDTIKQTYWSWQTLAVRTLHTPPALVTEGLQERGQYMKSLMLVFDGFNNQEYWLYSQRINIFRRGTSILTLSIGLITILLGALIGFSARRQTQAFIRRFSDAIDEATSSRDLLHTTLLSIGDAIIVTDAARRVTLLNRRAEELTGWTEAEAKGRPISEIFQIVTEAARQPIPDPISVALSERRTVELSNHALLLSRKGVEYPIDDSAAPIRNSRRQVVGAVLVFRDISARKESETEARKRESEFRALIENAPDVIIRYAPDLRITYVNPAIEHMLGIAPHALIGRRFKEVGIPEEVYGAWERAVQDVFLMQRSISIEIEYQTLHGFRRYQARLVPEIDDGKVQSVISISRDITDIKKIEQRLRNSEARFRGIIDNSPDAFFLLTSVRNAERKIADFSFEYVNEKAAAMITLSPEEILGKRLTEIMPGPTLSGFIDRYRTAIESGVPDEQEYQVHSPYLRTARWLHSLYIPIGDDLAVTTTDITERKRTEQALIASEERYRRLVDHTKEAIFSTDREGCIVYANPYILEISGYTAAEARKFRFTDLVAPADRLRVTRHFYRQFLSKTPTSYLEATFVTKSGEERQLLVTTTIQLENEEIVGFDCVATDITEERRVEAELKTACEQAQAILRLSSELTSNGFSQDVTRTAKNIAARAEELLKTSRTSDRG